MNARSELPLGLVHDLPNEAYHSIPAIGASGLKHLARSPAHYFGMALDPARPEANTTPAMRNGTLTHCALFEPDQLAARYVIKPLGLDGRTKDGKAWIAQQTLEVVDVEQMAAAQAQAAAVRRLPDVAALLMEGQPEVSAFWLDEETGEHCKCRPDWTSPAGDGVIIVDGKTCVDASPRGFQRAVVNFDYAASAAWYIDGYKEATGKRVYGYVFACVENTWPYTAAAYMLADDWIDAARARNRELLGLFAKCKATNIWPGYNDRIDLLEMPAWAR
jgi:hypothetical protein